MKLQKLNIWFSVKCCFKMENQQSESRVLAHIKTGLLLWEEQIWLNILECFFSSASPSCTWNYNSQIKISASIFPQKFEIQSKFDFEGRAKKKKLLHRILKFSQYGSKQTVRIMTNCPNCDKLSELHKLRRGFVCGFSVTRLGDLLDFGPLFKPLGNN